MKNCRLQRELKRLDEMANDRGLALYFWRTSPVRGRFVINFRAAFVPLDTPRARRFTDQENVLCSFSTRFTGTIQFDWLRDDPNYCMSVGADFVHRLETWLSEYENEA